MGEKKDQNVLIIGAGGHAQVVADILNLNLGINKRCRVVGYLDDDVKLHDKEIYGLPVIGSINKLEEIPHDGILVAIGDNGLRAEVFTKMIKQGEILINAVHPNTIIAANVKLGVGIVVCAGVVVNTGSEINNNVILNTGCTVDHHNNIREHVHLAPGCNLGGDVEIGEGTLIGIGAVVLPQTKVGKWSQVGAGAVVTENIKDNVIVIGVPAKFNKDLQNKRIL